MSAESSNEPAPRSTENAAPAAARGEHFRNIMLGLASAITAVVIPLLGFYYASRDKDREVAKDFVEISTKILSENPSEGNHPLREWAVAVLDLYSPVKLSDDLKALLLDKPLYTNTSEISQKTLQNLEKSGMVFGIFLSHLSTPPDFAALRAHQIEFAYIKLSQGESFTDLKAAEYVAQAKVHGLKVGLYHFFVPDADPDAQFANFQAALGRAPWDLPPMIDCEIFPGRPTPGDYAARVARFAQRIEDNFKIKPVIYVIPSFANVSLDQSVAKYPLFIANFGTAASRSNPTLPKWWTDYLFWHVADGVADDPILHPYDIIAFKGSAASLTALAPVRN